MSSSHLLFEVRTSRTAEHPLDQAVQFFATLPELHDRLWHQWLGKDERFSLEISVQNQVVTYSVLTPTRLSQYVQGLITASYPEAVITELTVDPIVDMFSSIQVNEQHLPAQVFAATFKLKNGPTTPLKTLKEFGDVDPLVGFISTLTQLKNTDRMVVQFLISPLHHAWYDQLLKKTASTTAGSSSSPETTPESKAPKKTKDVRLAASMRVLVSTPSAEKSRDLVETIGSAFQGLTSSNGNALVLKKHPFRQTRLQRSIIERTRPVAPRLWLSLEEAATLWHFPDKKLGHLPNIAWGKILPGEPPENLPIFTSELSPDQKKDINAFARAKYKGNETIYGLKRTDRRRHLYVIGKTGTGKSTLLANMAINDLKNNEGLCVIDPHGDLVETLLDYIPARRINDVVYFDPSDPERTVKINLFEGENVAHRELIASGIVSIFQKLYSYSWGPRLEYILRNALLTLLKTPQARLSDILDLLTNPKFREKIVATLDDPILKNFWVFEYDKLQERQRTDAIAPILNKVGQFVSSPLVRDVVNAHKSSFSIEEIMNDGKILLVNLSQGRLGEDNATLLGAMLITKIQLAAMSRVHIAEEERRDFFLYVDEFQNFATDSFIKILSEARKYRLNLTLANQYIAQIPEEVQKAIFGNCGSVVSFVMGAEDSAAFAKEYGDRYTNEDLVSLGRHQIINKVSIDNLISAPFPAMTLPLAKSSNQNRSKVLRSSRERYATKKKTD